MNRRILPVLAAAAALPLLAACGEDGTGLDTGPSSLDVRAYVDVDGSGTFNSGDDPIEGAVIELAGPQSAEATTNAEGVAQFEGLEPGSYQLSFAGDAPAGATLAGASNPVVVVSTLVEELTSDFRFVNFPGSVQGVLFRDDNDSGSFDAGDTPAPGIPVLAFHGDTVGAEPAAETTTDAEGQFTFTDLRPGTYTLLFQPYPTMELVGGNTQTVTVGPDTTSVSPVVFTGNVLSPVADARALAFENNGEAVAVEGVVVWQPEFSDEVFIQDETGGIQVYAGGMIPAELQIGDTVLVAGAAELRFGEPQITDVSTLTIQGSGPALAPDATTAAAVNAGEVQHELVMIQGATVDSVQVLDFGNQFVFLTDPAGNQFGVYADSRTGVEESAWTVGNVYDVAGVVGYDSRFAYANRIEVRGPEDVVPAEDPVAIVDAKAQPLGTQVTVSGVVSWQPGFGDELFIQDATGGIQVYAGDVNVSEMGLVPGDVVMVTGTTEERFGEVQLTDVTSVLPIGSDDSLTPIAVTAAEIAAGTYVHQLVTVENATVISVDDTWNDYGNQLVTLETPAGEQFGVYVDSRTGVATDHWTVGGVYDITGVINYDSRYGPFDYRIWIRGSGDAVAN